jgi:hypothetical protein
MIEVLQAPVESAVDLPPAVVDESVVVSAEEDAGSTTITGRVS